MKIEKRGRFYFEQKKEEMKNLKCSLGDSTLLEMAEIWIYAAKALIPGFCWGNAVNAFWASHQERVDISGMRGIYFTPSIVSRAHHSGHMTGVPYWKRNQRMHTYIMLHQKMNAQEISFLVFLSDSKHVYDSKIKKLYSSCKGGSSWFIYQGFKLYTDRERIFLLLMKKLLLIHLMNIICAI